MEKNMSDTEEPKTLLHCPVIVVDSPLLPGTELYLSPENQKNAALKQVKVRGKVFVVAKKDPEGTETIENLYDVGTIARINDVFEDNSGAVSVDLIGEQRALMHHYLTLAEPASAAIEPQTIPWKEGEYLEELVDYTCMTLENMLKEEEVSEAFFRNTQSYLDSLSGAPSLLADYMAGNFIDSPELKQRVLETLDVEERLQTLLNAFIEEKEDIRAYKEQKMVHKKGSPADEESELDKLARQIEESDMPDDAREAAKDDLAQLRVGKEGDSSYSVYLKHLRTLLAMPWGKNSELVTDLKKSKKILEADHYGLEDVKAAITEQLAVQMHTGKISGSIICLVGPPGVGKTSIGQSIARATGREFRKISLGGVHEEPAIRGHRITYIGAKEGRIVRELIKAGTMNPVIQLDEIDKLSSGSPQGNPEDALLEVLDPAQNNNFEDHYLGIPIDLSKILFITTANYIDNIPEALLDRMEVIEIAGYTDDEKVEIAKRYLINKQREEKVLTPEQFSITDAAVKKLIKDYEFEAGVRNLERHIGILARKVITQMKEGSDPVKITAANLKDYLGDPEIRHSHISKKDEVGTVNGLVVMGDMGGDILPITAIQLPAQLPGNGQFITTSSMAEVMQESIQVAKSFIRSQSDVLGIEPDAFDYVDIHIHPAQGAVPKDGPSAGLAMVTAIVSAMTDIPIHRNIAMTGEVDLKGNARAIGGLSHKLRGALEAGATTVIIPKENVRDLKKVPESVKSKLTIIPVSNVMEVLKHALVEMPRPLPKTAPAAEVASVNISTDQLVEALAQLFNNMAKPPMPQLQEPANDTRPVIVAKKPQSAVKVKANR
jgi:ATP-dependent Lon protease